MKYFKPYLQLFLLINVLYFTACSDDDPSDPVSTSDNRDDFVGLWSVDETSSIHGTSVYDSEIIKNSSNSSNVAIDNFYNLGVEELIQATVNGNQLSIPIQNPASNAALTIRGTGELIDNNTIEFNFTSDDGAEVDTVTCVYTKR